MRIEDLMDFDQGVLGSLCEGMLTLQVTVLGDRACKSSLGLEKLLILGATMVGFTSSQKEPERWQNGRSLPLLLLHVMIQ